MRVDNAIGDLARICLVMVRRPTPIEYGVIDFIPNMSITMANSEHVAQIWELQVTHNVDFRLLAELANVSLFLY